MPPLPTCVSAPKTDHRFSFSSSANSGNLDKQTGKGSTALHYCCLTDNNECLKLLLRGKASIEIGELLAALLAHVARVPTWAPARAEQEGHAACMGRQLPTCPSRLYKAVLAWVLVPPDCVCICKPSAPHREAKAGLCCVH